MYMILINYDHGLRSWSFVKGEPEKLDTLLENIKTELLPFRNCELSVILYYVETSGALRESAHQHATNNQIKLWSEEWRLEREQLNKSFGQNSIL